MPEDQQDSRLTLLVEGIVQIASGRLETRLECSPARDEVDAVITGINLLAEELQQVYQQFEERVESRTIMLQQAHLEMEKMALTDPLTGLANRRALIRAVEHALAGAARGELPPAVLLLDLDSFKIINDSLGHGAGDRVLQSVAQRLRAAVRESDTIARLGGDEFAILLPRATLGRAKRVGKRVSEALSRPIDLGDTKVVSAASIGLRLAVPGQSAEGLLLEADTAMYAAKAAGRSEIKVFEPVMLYARQGRSALAAELRQGITAGQLILHYQPVVDLTTGRIESVEALVRWNHPARGLVMPDDFIPIAEEIGAMVELGRWVLSTAATQLKEWQTSLQLDDDFKLRVNVSAGELQRIDLIDDVRKALSAAGVDPSYLILEITETAVVTGNELDRYSLFGLRKLGVGLEIDDFGTGYSSLSYLRTLPVDMVKVDRSLIGDLANDKCQRDFIAAILQLIRACGLGAVFEGVETQEQIDELKLLGCSSVQGYFYSRPVPAEKMALMLRQASDSNSGLNRAVPVA